MIAPYTLVLHGVMAFFCFIIWLYVEVLFKQKTHKNSVSHDLGMFFWFYFLFNIAIIIPLILGFSWEIINLGLVLGTTFLFAGLSYLVKIPLSLKMTNSDKIPPAISMIYLMIGFILLLLGIFTPYNHYANGKFVIWVPDSAFRLLNQAGQISAAWIFAAVFFNGFFEFRNSRLVRIRSLLFALSAIILSGSSYFYYQGNVYGVKLAFYSTIIGLSVAFIAVVIFGIFKNKQ